MKKSSKAVLFTALIFPGIGHFILKRKKSGTILVIVALVSFCYLLSEAINKALLISEKIISGEVSPDISVVMSMIKNSHTPEEIQMINIATVVLVICWLVAILDAFRIGRRMEIK